MSEIINTVLIWLGTFVGFAIIAGIIYLIIYLGAKWAAEKVMQEKQAQLDQQNQEFIEKEKRYKNYVKDSNAMLLNKKNETDIKAEQAKEMLMNADKIREQSQQKVDQLTRENSKLRNELNAARQRAKRLATKLETAG